MNRITVADSDGRLFLFDLSKDKTVKLVQWIILS